MSLRRIYARPMWRKTDLDRAMRAGELVAGEGWRDVPEGESAFSRVLADSVVWVPRWRRRPA